jgi:ABC-2 type transport system ATP-binding protein
MAGIGDAPAQVEPDERRVSVPTGGGTKALIAAGQRFSADHIDLQDLALRHPSLDDVFLTFTGAEAGAEAVPADEGGGT